MPQTPIDTVSHSKMPSDRGAGLPSAQVPFWQGQAASQVDGGVPRRRPHSQLRQNLLTDPVLTQ
jgi:hypothetical protein